MSLNAVAGMVVLAALTCADNCWVQADRCSMIVHISAVNMLLIFKQPAQLGFEHLAVIVFWQYLDKAVLARSLEASDVVEAQPVERRGFDRRLRPRHDKGD